MTNHYIISDVGVLDVKKALENNGMCCEIVTTPVFSVGGTAHHIVYTGFSPNTSMRDVVAFIKCNALLIANRVKLYSFGRHCSGMMVIGFSQ